MGWASFRHFCFICSLSNGCKFISGFASGHAAGSLGKLSMINLLSRYNTATFSIRPILIMCIIVDILIVKSSLLMFLGVIKSKKWLLCQWIWILVIGKILTDSAGVYLGMHKLMQGYGSEGISDILLSIGDALLYTYFVLVVFGLIKEIATEEAEQLLANEKR